MTTDHKLLLATRIAKSRRIAEYLKDEVTILEGLGLMEEAHAKAQLRCTHLRRCIRYTNRLIQHEA